MGQIPISCATCPYENCCDTAMAFEDCHFYYAREEKITFLMKIKYLLGKVFN